MSSPVMRRAAPIVFALALGTLNILLLIGPGPINPKNTAWIFGDNAMYYSAWEQYRHDPHLHFPLSWTERIGYPVGSSVAMLDGLPPVAALLRPLSPLLPVPFQYLGLWALLSFVLQAYFGYSLCRRFFGDSPIYCALGAVLFSLSLPLTARATGHTTLLSQWLILAALDGYFRDPGKRPVRWMWRQWWVAALAMSITPYIGVMCALLAVAAVGRLAIERRVGWLTAGVLLAATVAIVVASGATFGMVVSDDSTAYLAEGYGEFSWNLNSFVNPMGHGSILLPPLPLAHPRQLDGYSYLGLGVLALLAIGIVYRPQSLSWLAQRRLVPLVAVTLFCAAIAASVNVTFGTHRLFVVQLSDSALQAVRSLRASGRFIWPAYYLIDLGALAITYWIWRPAWRYAILAAALVLQIADATPIRHEVRAMCDQRFDNPTHDPAWQGLGTRYQDLVLVPAFQCGPAVAPGTLYSYVYFGKYAALERMRINSYYAARYTHAQMQTHCVDLMRGYLTGKLDPHTAYVVTNGVRTLWAIDGVTSHVCRSADDFNLCTPRGSEVGDAWKIPEPARYTLGDTIDFRHADGNARAYETFGWGDPSSLGAWTIGPLALLRVGLDASVDRTKPLVMQIRGGPFLGGTHQHLDVDVIVNGVQVKTWSYGIEVVSTESDATIPADVVRRRPGLDIEFRFRDPEAPLYAGAGAAPLYLGLAVKSVVIASVIGD